VRSRPAVPRGAVARGEAVSGGGGGTARRNVRKEDSMEVISKTVASSKAKTAGTHASRAESKHSEPSMAKVDGSGASKGSSGSVLGRDGSSRGLDGVGNHPEEARFEIFISHIKARGSVFRMNGLEYYLEFWWAGTSSRTPNAPSASSPKGCMWKSTVLHFDWKKSEEDVIYSDSMSSLQDSAVRRLDNKSTSENKDENDMVVDKRKNLVVECFGVKKSSLRDAEVFKVGSMFVDLETVMSGPVHHVFVLKPAPGYNESMRVSYNCRITQFARWKLALSRVWLEYDPAVLADKVQKDADAEASPKTSVDSAGSFDATDGDIEDVMSPEATPAAEEEPHISKTVLQLENKKVLEMLKQKSFVQDKTRRYVLRYKLFKTEGEPPIAFESSNSVFPQMDALGESHKAEWSSENLPTVTDHSEIRFRSFLASTVGFSIYEIKWEDSKVDGSNTSMIQQKGRLEGLSSFVVSNKDARLVGECWVPIEQLFELAQTHQDECRCFEDVEDDALKEKMKHPASVSISRDLVLFGKRVGSIESLCCFDPLPGSVQLGHGVLTDNGVELFSPIVLAESEEKPNFMQRVLYGGGGAGGNIGDHLQSASAKRLRNAIEQLQKCLKNNPRDMPHMRSRTEQVMIHNEFVKSCKELLTVLGMTEKDSMLSFVYTSNEELLRIQLLLAGLWELLLEWLDAATFSNRILFFEVIVAIIKRGELGEFMVGGSSLSGAEGGKDSDMAKFALQYRSICYGTLAWALRKLSLKGGFPELRQFCARIVAIMSFRLPKFGQLLYQAILPENEMSIKEWARSKALKRVLDAPKKKFLNPEWNAEWYALEVLYEANGNTSSNGSSSPRQSPRRNARKHQRSSSGEIEEFPSLEAISGKSNDETRPLRIGQTDHEMILNWKHFHRCLERFFGKAELEKQESVLPMGTTKDGNYQAPLWLRRIQKHGHFFFMYSSEWVTYVLDTLGLLATQSSENFEGRLFKSGIRWNNIIGYKHLLKAFLLELRRRDPKEYPESLRKMSLLLLVDNNLITPFANIVIPKTNVFDLDSVTTTVDLLSAWFTTIHGWPGRFVAARILRSTGPHTPLSADEAMQNARSLFFTKMRQSRKEQKEQDINSTMQEVKVSRSEDSGEEDHDLDVSPPPAPLAQLRAAGTLSGGQVSQHRPPTAKGIVAEPTPEPFVSPWDFDAVCIYFPHLDVVRRKFKRSEAEQLLPGGITANNDRSKCNWFSYLYADTPPLLPNTFEFKLLSHMLWILLHQAHFQVVLKTIELIYNHWNSFPLSFQDRIRAMLLQNPNEEHHGHDHHIPSRERQESLYGAENKSLGAALVGAPFAPLADGEKESQNLFLSLFYHWQEEVRHFMHTLLAFKLCRGREKTPALTKLLAAVRVALISTEEAVWDVLWQPVDSNDKFWMQKIPPSPVRLLQREYLLGKSLHRRFEDDEASANEPKKSRPKRSSSSGSTGSDGGGRSPTSWLKRRPPSKEAVTSGHMLTAGDEEFFRTKSFDDVKDLISSLAKDEDKFASVQRRRSDEIVPEKADKLLADLRKDLEIVGHDFWPLPQRAYAVPSVTKFKRIWLNSLDPNVHSPVLEWSIVVMDRGEMRSIGGLAHFQPPSRPTSSISSW